MPETEPSRPRRKDARENRERILAHAASILADEGFDVGLHRIADDLGLGVGTVYRHFPTREHLFLGLYEQNRSRIDVAGEALLKIDDAFEQVVAFIDITIAFSLASPIARQVAVRVQRAFPDAVRRSPWELVIIAAVERAIADGRIRPDVHPTDIAMLAGMLADLVGIGEPQRDLVVPRMRALVIDAIRPLGDARPVLPAEPVSLDDLLAISHRRSPGSSPSL
jgi:AcrR family transcriptional regulator